MKYMILIQGTKQQWDEMRDWSEEDVRRNHAYMSEINRELVASGEWVAGHGLTGPDHLKTVRARPDGDMLITDGPYPETKEVLAGFWIVDVDNEQRALDLAARVSAGPGRGGEPVYERIEVHRVDTASD